MALLAKVGGPLASVGTGLELAIQELGRIPYVSDEIRRLISRMNWINAVLKDAEKKQTGGHEIRQCLWELKQVVLDAEDLLDEFATYAAVESMGAHTYNYNNPTMAPAMGDQIREINDRLDHLEPHTKMLSFHMPTVEDSSSLEWSRRRQTSSLLPDETSVIGRDREKEKIIKLLMSPTQAAEFSNDRGFTVLPIVGMGGVGKTTLARLVFNDRNVKKHFELMMWVCVSTDFDLVRLTKEMVDAAFAFEGKNEQYKTTNWDSMQRELLQEVEGKTFLLVLDDVWEAEPSQWEELFKPLHFGKNGSKILVTARNRAVVDKIQGQMDPILLTGLSDADIWYLFKRYAFNGVTNADGTIFDEYSLLQKIGRFMVPRLKGSPLATRTIGSLLNAELYVEHWKAVLENELWRLPQGEDGILPALALSYMYLCGDLKQCFAYCSLFPKGYMFDKEDVVQLWEAQRFIRPERGRRIETTGSKYFDELLHRSFFGIEASCCVVHDLIHDLAEYVSRDDCFRLEDDDKSMEIPEAVRHISFCVSKSNTQTFSSLCRYGKLRTLLFLRWCKFDDLTTHVLDELFLKLKLLRVLGLRGCGITELPSSIGELKHLRYLDLSWNGVENLPESLGSLYNLGVLKLEHCSLLGALPSTMSQLINLRHLQADYELVSGINGLCKLTGLEELEVRGRKVRELRGMRLLRRLTILKLEEVDTKVMVIQGGLRSMELLQVLRLGWRDVVDQDFCSELDGGTGRNPVSIKLEVKVEEEEEVLRALRPNQGIKELYISGYGGAKSPVWMEPPMLSSFLSLRLVALECCPSWRVLPASLSQLRCLESLTIKSMPRWEKWDGDHYPNYQRNPSSAPLFFPRLRELQILRCPNLKVLLPYLPPTLRYLRLEQVGLSRLPGLWGSRSCEEMAMQRTTSSSHSPSVPAAALSTLHIRSCYKLTSISQLLRHHLTALEEMSVDDCVILESLPEMGFGHLVSLKKLCITNCPNLTCLPLAWEEEDAPTQHLPFSLKKLEIKGCGDAMGGWWWAGLQRLTCLAQLYLQGCPATAESLFASLGRHHYHHHLPATLKQLEISECGCDHRQQEYTISTLSTLPPSSPPLNPPVDASAGVLRALTSLTELTIRGSPNLLRKWGGCGLPSSLQGLTISGGDHFDDGFLSTCLRDLTSVDTLTIEGDDNLDDEFMSAFLLECTSFKKLTLKYFENLRSLPDTLSCLSSLECLELHDCRSIRSLPTSGLLPSLVTLKIYRCPALTEGCKLETKSMWPGVSHIPNIVIDGRSLC